MNDKKVIIERENELVKLAVIDLTENGEISSFSVRVFANDEKASDENILAWAKKAVAPEEAEEVEQTFMEDYVNDSLFSQLEKSLADANTITNDLDDNPQTTVNEAEAETE